MIIFQRIFLIILLLVEVITIINFFIEGITEYYYNYYLEDENVGQDNLER